MLKTLIINLFIILLFVQNAFAQKPIILNESFDEWKDIEEIAPGGGLANIAIKVTNTDQHLFIYLEIDEIISIQKNQKLLLTVNSSFLTFWFRFRSVNT